jgi:hypothetical protein
VNERVVLLKASRAQPFEKRVKWIARAPREEPETDAGSEQQADDELENEPHAEPCSGRGLPLDKLPGARKVTGRINSRQTSVSNKNVCLRPSHYRPLNPS